MFYVTSIIRLEAKGDYYTYTYHRRWKRHEQDSLKSSKQGEFAYPMNDQRDGLTQGFYRADDFFFPSLSLSLFDSLGTQTRRGRQGRITGFPLKS